MKQFDYNKYLKNNPLLKEEETQYSSFILSPIKDLAYKLPSLMQPDNPDGTYSSEQIMAAINKYSPYLKKRIKWHDYSDKDNMIDTIKKYIGNEEEQQADKESSTYKLGDIFRYTDARDEESKYYILAKSKNPNKPNVVGLWTVNPRTMADSLNWKGRKMWNQAQVEDPNNLTKRDWINILDWPLAFSKFEKVN